jgi:lipoate-protein ligase A
MSEWRFIDSGASDGRTNMAIDAAILEGVDEGRSGPAVRVYAWEPPTVSTGNSQRASLELDLDACRGAGLGVVRRPTGGRAVLHYGELTYSVVGPAGEAPLGDSISETYESIATALVLGLAHLGVRAELAPVATTARGRGEAAPPCFVSAGRFEVVVGGRKLIGSAQRRRGRAVLQHGSLLIDDTHTGLADVMRVRRESDREAVRDALRAKTTDLKSLLGRPVGFAEVASAVRLGFESAWGIALSDGSLTEGEETAFRRLASEYGDWL